MTIKQKLWQYAKNIPGWSTRRKIVVFSVDDFGNIRLGSRDARARLLQKGMRLDQNRFDQFDTLETAEDLEALFGTLCSVKDSANRNAVFTAFALPANINFDVMEREGYVRYRYQLLPETLEGLSTYAGAWSLWKQGIKDQIFIPQFHGREHVNIQYLMRGLANKDPNVLAVLKEHSWAGLSGEHWSFTSAFSFDQVEEIPILEKLVIDGLNVFEQVFGYRATHFNSPGSPHHSSLEKTLANGGIKFIDTTMLKSEHQGGGEYRTRFYRQGQRNQFGQTYQLRNCVFEPLLDGAGAVQKTVNEIDIAFRCHKPAIISSHRVNFCGAIDANVRRSGLESLKQLLRKIVKQWPDVEFMAANELGRLMNH